MKVALIHDFLNQVGGAEKVLEIFHELYPKAPVFTITHDKTETGNAFKGMDITTSFIQRLPGGPRRYKWYLAWMPAAIEQFDLSKYDVVLSDCSAYSKGVITKPETMHICYCHSPTRYLWSDTHAYTEELKQPSVIKKGLPLILNRIRVWDKLASERVDNFIANSKNVKERIKKYYNRNSQVIYPPVDINKFKTVSKNEVGNYYLIVSRLRPYKRVDIAVEAFNALELPLKVIGTGEEYKKLKKIANKNIEFLGYVKDEERNNLLSRCKAFIHPQEEDFGIAAVEAMAAGRPVIAYKKGGALETVQAGVTGEFFEDQTPWSLVDTVREFDAGKYEPEEVRKSVLSFDTDVFKQKIKNFVEESYLNNQEKNNIKL